MNERSVKPTTTPLNNQTIAGQLDSIAELLEAQNANPFRVRAYREAAQTVRTLGEPASVLLEKEGRAGLCRLPTIGESISRSIEQLIHTGKINLLEQLRGETSPERVLATVPGIGPKLANRIHEKLGIETLADLEAATYDGRLEQVEGFGRGRVRGVRESLAGRLHRRPIAVERLRPQPTTDQPPVAELLDLDRDYRTKVKEDRLPKVAPRRFNPTGQPWLPILHTERGQSHYTVLFSNTARAHELGTIRDWVVIYRDDHNGAGQWTVVTARYGALQGKRVVRGRDSECASYYATQAAFVSR
jgi:DNA polymerase (family 10)